MLNNNKKKAWIKGSAFSSVVLAASLLTACGGGGGGSSSDGGSAPTIEITYPKASTAITLKSIEPFTIKATNCNELKVFLGPEGDAQDISEPFVKSCVDGNASASFAEVKHYLRDGSDELRASINGSGTSSVTFKTNIASGDIIITSASKNLAQPGVNASFNLLTRKKAWESISIEVDGSVDSAASGTNALNNYTFLIPDLDLSNMTSSLDDKKGDFSITTTYPSGETTTVNLAANGHTFKTLNAMQLNNNAFTEVTPWLAELVVAFIGEGQTLVENDPDVCILAPKLGSASGASDYVCDLAVIDVGFPVEDVEYNLTDSALAPEVNILFNEQLDDGSAKLGLSIVFDKVRVRIVAKKNGLVEGAVDGVLSLVSGKLEANLEAVKDGTDFALKFSDEGSFVSNLAFKQREEGFDDTYSQVTSCDGIVGFCDERDEGVAMNVVGTEGKLNSGIIAGLEKQLDEKVDGGKSLRESFFEKARIKPEENPKPVVDNEIAKVSVSLPGQIQTINDGDESKRGALLSFGGRTVLTSDNFEKGKAALGSLLSQNEMTFLNEGMSKTNGINIAVTQNMINQLIFVAYQKEIDVQTLNTTIPFADLGNPSVEMTVTLTLESLPSAELSPSNEGLWLKVPNVVIEAINTEEEQFTKDGVTVTLPKNKKLFTAVIDLDALLLIDGENDKLTLVVDPSQFGFSIVPGSIKLGSYIANVADLSLGQDYFINIIKSNLLEVIPREVPVALNELIEEKLSPYRNKHIYQDMDKLLPNADPELMGKIYGTLPKTYQLNLSENGIVVGESAVYIGGALKLRTNADAENSLLTVTICSSKVSGDSIAACPAK